jgi:hypothetical protein
VVLVATGAPGEAEDLQAQAETAFREGAQLVANGKASGAAQSAFRRAAELYEKLEQSGCRNAALYRDLGNAYLLADDRGRAVLAYHRGLRLKPNDLELRRCLDHVRQQVAADQGDFGRPPVELRPPWLPRLPGATPWLVLALYMLGCAGVTRWWTLRRGTWLLLGGCCFALAALLAAGLTWEGLEDRWDAQRPLVVIAAKNGVLLHSGNGSKYDAVSQTRLSMGVEARRLFVRGDWLQIELSSGEIGWVPRSQVLEDR